MRLLSNRKLTSAPSRCAPLARIAALLLLAIFCVCPAQASVSVLVGEPFGPFGTMMPVGHTAVFVDHVCADGPLKLRPCHPGETQGIVIARYHQLGQYDFLISPVMEFLYAADRPEDVLSYATLDNSWELRQVYRRKYLAALIPDGHEYDPATNEWWESAGTAYTRRIWGYSLASTPEQDLRFIQYVNQLPNRHAYRLNNDNCADFAAKMINVFYPGAVRHDRVADFGWMTPKQVARSVESYGHTHPGLDPHVFEVPQVPGSLRRSRPVRGAAEAGIKTKRYLATLLLIQPEVPLICSLLYLNHGRWQIGRNADIFAPADVYAATLPPADNSIVATR